MMTKQSWPLVLGVDISAHSLKYVLLRRKGKNLKIEAFGRYRFDGSELEPYEVAQRSVEWLYGKHPGLKKAKAVIGISGGKVVVKTESFPKLSRKELLQTIFYELVGQNTLQ